MWSASSAAPRPRRVLIAEDDATTRDALCEVLREEGYEVAEAHNGAEALALVSRFEPDLLLTDVKMPLLDGVSLALLVREQQPALPVLLMAASPTTEQTRRARREGLRWLPKPLELSDLLSTVATITRHH